jgi:transcription factor E2F3
MPPAASGPAKKKAKSSASSKTSSSSSSSSKAAGRSQSAAGKPKPVAKKGSRYDSSLGILTKKFVQLIRAAPNNVLDLNTAAKDLGVQKRRIYDITNVLEGIGLIGKESKNNIIWKGVGLDSNKSESESKAAMEKMKHELADLEKQELLVDDYIRRMQDMVKDLSEAPENKELAFVTYDDIRSLPNFAGDTLIAIKAPPGTTLEVPDPDQGMPAHKRRYQIWLKSSSGPIDVYLVRSPEEESDTNATGNAASTGPIVKLEPPKEITNQTYEFDSMQHNEGISDLF